LRELKEEGIIEIKRISTHENCLDILTKKLSANPYKKCDMLRIRIKINSSEQVVENRNTSRIFMNKIHDMEGDELI
jgi:hypothetical protein